MAKIAGIEMKNVKVLRGREGDFIQCNLYLDGKRLGFYSQDGDGGEGWFEEEVPGGEKMLVARIREYYKKHPAIDQLAIFRMTENGFVKKKTEGQLPVRDFTNDSYEFLLDVFIEDLFSLRESEQAWKKSVKNGYKAYVDIKFFHVRGTPMPLDYGFSTNGKPEVLAEIQKTADGKSPANIVTQYDKPEDFVMEL